MARPIRPATKLTADQVRRIRKLRADGVPGWAVAQRFGVSQSCVTSILKGRSWRWLEAESEDGS